MCTIFWSRPAHLCEEGGTEASGAEGGGAGEAAARSWGLLLGHRRRHDGRSANFRQNVARFRLYRLRFLQENMRVAAFFKIYQISKLKFLKFDKILQILRRLQFFAEISRKLLFFSNRFFAKILRLQRCKRMQIL